MPEKNDLEKLLEQLESGTPWKMTLYRLGRLTGLSTGGLHNLETGKAGMLVTWITRLAAESLENCSEANRKKLGKKYLRKFSKIPELDLTESS